MKHLLVILFAAFLLFMGCNKRTEEEKIKEDISRTMKRYEKYIDIGSFETVYKVGKFVFIPDNDWFWRFRTIKVYKNDDSEKARLYKKITLQMAQEYIDNMTDEEVMKINYWVIPISPVEKIKRERYEEVFQKK